jgi:hypothetical protein
MNTATSRSTLTDRATSESRDALAPPDCGAGSHRLDCLPGFWVFIEDQIVTRHSPATPRGANAKAIGARKCYRFTNEKATRFISAQAKCFADRTKNG